MKHKPASSQPVLFPFSARGPSLPSPPLPCLQPGPPIPFPKSALLVSASVSPTRESLEKEDGREDERGGKVLIKRQMFNFVS